MKQILVVAIALIASIQSYGQKTITAEQMKTFTKGAFEAADFDQYVALDGHTYKVGDTLKIGRPSVNKTFTFIINKYPYRDLFIIERISSATSPMFSGISSPITVLIICFFLLRIS